MNTVDTDSFMFNPFNLLILGQLFLYIGAFFGTLSLLLIALPLNFYSWSLILWTFILTLTAMCIAVALLFLQGLKCKVKAS